MNRVIGAFTDVAKGVMSGTKKLLAQPPKKPMPPPEKNFLTETDEEYAKRLMQRRARRY